ncbi:MAG TPA: condensation domain-containing protein, partial [Kofleriaceae bacterium]|nr:condensation domain-containing protein [Kofleriaceae bacterium]
MSQTVQDLLRRLRTLDIRLWVEGERLRYSARQGSLDDGLLSELRTWKPQLLAFLREAADAHRSVPAIERVPRDRPLALSFAQERMWFLHEFQAEGQGRATYNMTGGLRLEGELDLAALRAAFTEIVRRHEALRTRFHLVDGALRAAIAPPHEIALPVVELDRLAPGERDAEIRRRSRDEALRPFDLAGEPLLRTAVFRLAADHHLLLVNMHHMVSDGWSLGVLIRELGALYRAYRAGRGSPLPELEVQYADYAAWQRGWLTGSVLDRQLAFWRDHLRDVPALLELPTDRPRPALQSYRGALVPVELDAQTARRVHALGKQHRATPFMVLLAGYAALLSRYSGALHLAIGTPVANRRPSTEPLIGFFMNTMVIPVRVDPDAGFVALLDEVRRFSLEAQMHQDVPFEHLVEAVHPERSLSHTPVFQVMFILQNTPAGALELPGLRATMVDVERVTAKFDLTLSLEDRDGRFTGWLEYASDLFDRATAERIAGHYARLLHSALDAPERPIHALELLSADEDRALRGCRGPAVAIPPDGRIHTLIAAIAARFPERAALAFEHEAVSHGELDRRANQLAHHLRGLGVGPEQVVALQLGRSLDLVVCMLGVLKAGAAYLPLDPGMPGPRLAHILSDSGAAVVITAERWLAGLPPSDARVIVIDRDREREAIARCPATAPADATAPSSRAYLIYTSGSTGAPKGVSVEHRNAVNFFLAMDLELGVAPDGAQPPGTWLALTTFA